MLRITTHAHATHVKDQVHERLAEVEGAEHDPVGEPSRSKAEWRSGRDGHNTSVAALDRLSTLRVHAPLDVVLRLRRLKGAHGEVGGQHEADEVRQEAGEAGKEGVRRAAASHWTQQQRTC